MNAHTDARTGPRFNVVRSRVLNDPATLPRQEGHIEQALEPRSDMPRARKTYDNSRVNAYTHAQILFVDPANVELSACSRYPPALPGAPGERGRAGPLLRSQRIQWWLACGLREPARMEHEGNAALRSAHSSAMRRRYRETLQRVYRGANQIKKETIPCV
jgi:hypothetical protein